MAEFPTQFVKLNTDRFYAMVPGQGSNNTFTADNGYSVSVDGPWVLLSKDGWGQRIPANQVTNLVYTAPPAQPSATTPAGTTPTKSTPTKTTLAGPADQRGIPLGTDANEQSSMDPREVPKGPHEPTEAEVKDGRARADAELKKQEAEAEMKKASKKLEDAQKAEQAAHAEAVKKDDIAETIARAVAGKSQDVEVTQERDGKMTVTKGKK